jgi:DNA-binding protein YbaB
MNDDRKSWYGIKRVWGGDGRVKITVQCRLESLGDVNELIDMIVKAKNEAFPSGATEHKKAMEVLNGEAEGVV